VLLNGRRIRGTVLVEQGDLIEIGSHRFLFEKAEPPKAANEQEDSLLRQAVRRNGWRDAWEETVILDYDAVMPQILAPPSVFVIRSGAMEGQSFLLDRPLLTIGRGSESDVVIRDSSISRRHAQFIRQADGDYVLDLASRNGTKVNNEPLRAPRLLQHGDVISMGNVRLEYTSMLDASTTPLPPLSLPSLIRPGSGPVPLRLPSKPKSE
jgi:pSer/pThr/pTyr-binding forkhead associated (FHA) protein